MRHTRDLESLVRRAYHSERLPAGNEGREAVVGAMMREARSCRRADRLDALASFVGAQVRFVGWRAWAAQTVVVVLMAAVCTSGAGGRTVAAATSLLAATSAAIGLPWLLASRAQGMAELERSCPFGAGSVALARLLVLGMASALSLTGILVVAPALAGTDPVITAVRAAAPYLLSCAGALALGMRSSRTDAALAGVTWVTLVAASSCAVYAAVPAAYDAASVWVWGVASGVSAAWSLAEAISWVRACAYGMAPLPNRTGTPAL